MTLGIQGSKMLLRLSTAKIGPMRNTVHYLQSNKIAHETRNYSKTKKSGNNLYYIAGAAIFCFAELSAEEAILEGGDVTVTAEEPKKVTDTEEEATEDIEDEKSAVTEANVSTEAKLGKNETIAEEKAGVAAEEEETNEAVIIGEGTFAREQLQKYTVAAAVVIVSSLLLLKAFDSFSN